MDEATRKQRHLPPGCAHRAERFALGFGDDVRVMCNAAEKQHRVEVQAQKRFLPKASTGTREPTTTEPGATKVSMIHANALVKRSNACMMINNCGACLQYHDDHNTRCTWCAGTEVCLVSLVQHGHEADDMDDATRTQLHLHGCAHSTERFALHGVWNDVHLMCDAAKKSISRKLRLTKSRLR